MRRIPTSSSPPCRSCSCLGAWVAVTSTGLIRDLFLPGPADLWFGFSELMEEGYKGRTDAEHLGMSLLRVGAGFLTGALAGTVLGLAMGVSRRLDAAAAPFVEFLRPLAAARLSGAADRLARHRREQQDHHALPRRPAGRSHRRARRRAQHPRERVRMAQALGASPRQVFWHVVAPRALPEILTGARLALGIVYGTLIASEIIAGATASAG